MSLLVRLSKKSDPRPFRFRQVTMRRGLIRNGVNSPGRRARANQAVASWLEEDRDPRGVRLFESDEGLKWLGISLNGFWEENCHVALL